MESLPAEDRCREEDRAEKKTDTVVQRKKEEKNDTGRIV